MPQSYAVRSGHNEYGNDDAVYPLTDKESETIGKYIEEGTADYGKLMSGDYVLVSDNSTVEEIYGWRFHVGDKITLHYYDGSKMAERKVAVLGILNKQFALNNDRLEGWFLMPERAILSFISYDSLNANLLVSAEPEKEAAVGEILMRMIGEKPNQKNAAFRESAVGFGCGRRYIDCRDAVRLCSL